MSIYMYNKIDITRIKFSEMPYKKSKDIQINDEVVTKFVYYIDVYYKKNPLYIQLPKCILKSVNVEDNVVKLVIDNEFNNNFINQLENHVINSVHKYSEMWFNGKLFTMNKITNCIVKNVTSIDDNQMLLSLTLDKQAKFYNQYKMFMDVKEKTIQEELNNECNDIICVVKIANLQFIDNRFTYNIVLEQAKIFRDYKITEYSILDESEPDNVSSDLEDEYYKDPDERNIDSINHNFF